MSEPSTVPFDRAVDKKPTALGLRRSIAGLAAAILAASMAGRASAAEVIPIESASDLNAFLYIGPMRAGDDLKMLSHLSNLPKKRFTAVYLYSGGGDLNVGMELGRIFRDYKVRTIVQPMMGNEGHLAALAGVLEQRKIKTLEGEVMSKEQIGQMLAGLRPGMCASACSLAFLGGRDSVTGKPWRLKAASARLGFHSFAKRFPPGNYSAEHMSLAIQDAQRTVFDVLSYMEDIDLSSRFAPVMFKMEASEMNWISNREAHNLGIEIWNDELPTDTGYIPSNRVAPAGGQNFAQQCPVEPQQ